MVKYALVLVISAVALSSCFYFDGERVRGNGDVKTEERSLSDFNGIESHGSFDVYLTTDSSYSVKVEADENLLDYIVTEVDGRELEIRTRRGYSLRPSETVKVYVSAPRFRVVNSSGSGNVYGKNAILSDDDLEVGISGSGNIDLDVKAGKVSADIAGSGSITLDGEADAIRSSIAGSGDIKAANLRTREAKVHIAGSGNAALQATDKLDVEIAGSGDVRYSGEAKVNSHIAGSGSVRKID
jgi:hypothetical protein